MQKNIFRILLLLLCLFFLNACGTQRLCDTNVFAMDTVITLRLPENTDPAILKTGEELITVLDGLLSRTNDNSDITLFRRTNDTVILSPDTIAVLNTALSVAKETNGAYDPTIAPLTELWHITDNDGTLPTSDEIKDCLTHIGWEHLTLTGDCLSKDQPEIRLDLGGCAKGYACERVVKYLQESGVSTGLVSFGGNIGIVGPKENRNLWSIGIKHPDNSGKLAGYLHLDRGYVSVSGDYERYFELDGVRYHHILDAKTGYPADSGIRSAAVWSEDGTLADALSTAVFVLGTDETLRLYDRGVFDFEAVIYTTDNKTFVTSGIAGNYEHAASDIAAPDTSVQ